MVADIGEELESLWCRLFFAGVYVATNEAATCRRLGKVPPHIIRGGFLLNPKLVVQRKNARTAAVPAQLETAAVFRFHRYQNTRSEREQAAEVVGGHRRRPGRSGIGKPRRIDAQRAPVGQVESVERIAAPLVVNTAHDQASSVLYAILARRRSGRAGEHAALIRGALSLRTPCHFHPAPPIPPPWNCA